MSRVALRRIVVLVLFVVASPPAARASDWKDRFDFSLVAVMRMIDGGDPDDKLIAVVPGSPFDGKSLADLEGAGVTAILKTWFESYKGPGEIQVAAFEGEAAAEQVLADAAAAYEAPVPVP